MTYLPAPLNTLQDDRPALLQRLAARINEAVKPSVKIDAGQAEYRISGLPKGRVYCRFTSPSTAGRNSLTVDLAAGTRVELGTLPLDTGVTRMDLGPPRPVDPADAQKVLETVQGLAAEDAVKKELLAVASARLAQCSQDAVVLIGQVEVPDKPHLATVVQAQMRILPGGYFAVNAVPGQPIGLRLHGYQPLNVTARGGQGHVERLDKVRLVPTPSSEKWIVTGQVQWSGQNPAGNYLRVWLRDDVDVDAIHWGGHPGTGHEGLRGWFDSVDIAPDKTFRIEGLSPIDYWLTAELPGRGPVDVRLRLGAATAADGARHLRLETIELPPALLATIQCSDAPAGLFRDAGPMMQVATVDLQTDVRWAVGAQNSTAENSDLHFEQLGNTMLVYPDFRYQDIQAENASLTPLGTGGIGQYMKLDATRLDPDLSRLAGGNVQRVVAVPQGDMVYLLKRTQRGQPRWSLLHVQVGAPVFFPVTPQGGPLPR